LGAAMELLSEEEKALRRALVGKVVRGLKLVSGCRCEKTWGVEHDHLIIVTDDAKVELITWDVESYASGFDIYINGERV